MRTYRNLSSALQEVYPSGEAQSIARWVLEERFNLTMADIMMDKDNELSAEQQEELQNILLRLQKKEPVQYVLGQTSFRGIPFDVEEGVLIPRPETQELVGWILADRDELCPSSSACPAHSEAASLTGLDIGTGSGCIAVSLAKEGVAMEAWDISTKALEVAQRNARKQGVSVDFRIRDILHCEEKEEEEAGQYDFIVSNPPYICEEEASGMDDNVLLYEPHLALFVPDADPLLFYREIARFALRHLKPDGMLYFEINRRYGTETCALLRTLGFADVELRKDEFGNDRMVRGKGKLKIKG